MKPMQDWPIKPAGVAYVIASMFARSPALQDTGVVVLPHLHTPCSVLICEEETQPPTSHRMQKHLMRQLIVHFPPPLCSTPDGQMDRLYHRTKS